MSLTFTINRHSICPNCITENMTATVDVQQGVISCMTACPSCLTVYPVPHTEIRSMPTEVKS